MTMTSTLLLLVVAVLATAGAATLASSRVLRAILGSAGSRPRRVLLPMCSGVAILPDTSAQVTARAQNQALQIDGLIIDDPACWVVNDVLIDGVSRFTSPGDVPASLFSAEAQGAGIRLGVAEVGAPVQVVVTRVAPVAGDFRCVVLGTPARGVGSSAVVVAPDRLILPVSSGVSIPPGKSVQITSSERTHAMILDRLVIEDAQDWVVNDLRVGNRSQLLQCGDVPGGVFRSTAGVSLHLEPLLPREDLVVVATYVGDSPEGVPLLAAFVGDAVEPGTRAASRGHAVLVRIPTSAPTLEGRGDLRVVS